jgi:ABC-2 type transport system ATP-binding protein
MLEIKELQRRFGERVAVDRVSMTVSDGELVGFVGGNGAGKTTTMRMIMGVLAADAGEICWNGSPTTAAVRRRFGYMPEERGLYPKQAVLDQLTYLGRLQGRSAGDAARIGAQLLDRFSLSANAKDKLESLSLGNQQRVQIAAAMIADPQLLVLDEPFSGLDPGAVDSMADLLRERAAQGVGVLFSSHQLDLVERLCDRLVILSRGRVAASGTAEELRGRGPVRHRLTTRGEGVGWVHGLPWLEVVEVDGATAVLELSGPDDVDRLLLEALKRGPVRELAEIVPSVADVFRRVSA